ncbi:MAG: DUF4148 domain-containing protein [Variovorax sp.]|nr:MAG: DUF4148 domain-containing protein [Variovorax sp.]
MNRTLTLLALTLASLAGAASAQNALPGDSEAKPFVSTKSRAEVRAELDAANQGVATHRSLRFASRAAKEVRQ